MVDNRILTMMDKFDGKIDDLHEKTNGINIKVGKIEEHLKFMNGSITKQQTTLYKTDNRLRWLENKVHIAIGGVGVLAFVLTRVMGLW